MLTVFNEYAREALCVAVRPKMDGNDMMGALFDLIVQRGKPKFIRSDNGSEFIAKHLQTWLRKVGIQPIQIRPHHALNMWPPIPESLIEKTKIGGTQIWG